MREAWLAPLERDYLQSLLTATGGNVRQAARRAGVNAVTFYRLLRKRQVAVVRERTGHFHGDTPWTVDELRQSLAR